MKKIFFLLFFLSLLSFEVQADTIYILVDGQLVVVQTGINPPVDHDGEVIPLRFIE